MRLLIVVTAPRSLLWKATERANWQPSDLLGETEARVRHVGQDAVLAFRQADISESDSDTEREEENRAWTTPWVVAAATSAPFGAAEEVYVAAHDGYVATERVRDELPSERLGACVLFHHEAGQSPFVELLNLFKHPDPNTFEAALDAVKKKEELTHSQRLTTLKHRLAHLFLPVSIDLQAWREFDFDDEYRNEMLTSYSGDEGRLARARGLLYERGRPAGAETVQKLVNELGLEGSDAWGRVQSLIPPREPASREEIEKATFYVEVFQTKNVLGNLREKDGLNWLRGVLEAGDDSFNEWYIALEVALAELRGEMERRQRDRAEGRG